MNPMSTLLALVSVPAFGDPAPRLAFVVHPTDAVREWAYDRSSPAGA